MFPIILLVGVGLAIILSQRKGGALPSGGEGSHIEVANAGEMLYEKIHARVPMQDWALLSPENRAAVQGIAHGAMVLIREGRESLRDVALAIAGPIIEIGNANDPAGVGPLSFARDLTLQNNVSGDVRDALTTLTRAG